jgi:hypothetical protein
MGNKASTLSTSDPAILLTDTVNQTAIETFKNQNPSKGREISLYKNAVDLFANRYTRFLKVLEIAEQEMKIVNPETGEEVGILHPSIIKDYINPQWTHFQEMYENTRSSERGIFGLGEVSALAKKNRIEKIDKMYNGIRDAVNALLAKHKDLQKPFPIEAYDPNSLLERLKRINLMGGRRTRHRKRKLKRKTRR